MLCCACRVSFLFLFCFVLLCYVWFSCSCLFIHPLAALLFCLFVSLFVSSFVGLLFCSFVSLFVSSFVGWLGFFFVLLCWLLLFFVLRDCAFPELFFGSHGEGGGVFEIAAETLR